MATVVTNIPVTTPMDTLILSSNQLSQIPSDLPQYAQLASLSVASNAITSIAASQVALTANATFLDFSMNQISAIAAGALPGTKNSN